VDIRLAQDMIAFRNERERQMQARRCSTCKQTKHLSHFSGKCARCKICNREYTRWYRATRGGREPCEEYNARFAARPVLTVEDRAESKEAARRRYRASELGKLTHHISVTRRKLRQDASRSDRVRKTCCKGGRNCGPERIERNDLK
jgi:hypothetical protein